MTDIRDEKILKIPVSKAEELPDWIRANLELIDSEYRTALDALPRCPSDYHSLPCRFLPDTYEIHVGSLCVCKEST